MNRKRYLLSLAVFFGSAAFAQDVPFNAWPSVAPRDPLHHDYSLKPRESVFSFQHYKVTYPSSPVPNRVPSAAFLWNPTNCKRWTLGLITKNDFHYLKNQNEGYLALLFNFFRKEYRTLTAGFYAGFLDYNFKKNHFSEQPAFPVANNNPVLNFHLSLAYTRSWISASYMIQNVTQPNVASQSYERYHRVHDFSFRLNFLRDKKTGVIPFADMKWKQQHLYSRFAGLYVRRHGMLYGLALGDNKRLRAGAGLIVGPLHCSLWLQGLSDPLDKTLHKEFVLLNLLIKTGGR